MGNGNDLGTLSDRNPEIYQFNLGLQHLFPAGIVISADYSANRSTHLPWGGATRNRDTLPTAARLGLEPPRFCAECGRRMVVQVRPDGWWAKCSRHGLVDSADLEARR